MWYFVPCISPLSAAAGVVGRYTTVYFHNVEVMSVLSAGVGIFPACAESSKYLVIFS
jgi:hypothetical protein